MLDFDKTEVGEPITSAADHLPVSSTNLSMDDLTQKMIMLTFPKEVEAFVGRLYEGKIN